MFRTHKRTLAFAPLIAAVAFMTACDDDPVEPPDEHADEVDTIRLAIGEETIDITSSGAEGDITIPVGDTPVSATFWAEDGDEVDIHDDEFEVQILSDDTDVVTYTPSSSFDGTLTGVNAGSAIVEVQLFHLEEGHPDFGPHDVNVLVE